VIRYWLVVTTVALFAVVDVFTVICTFARTLRKARTASARDLASFVLPLAYPVTTTVAPATSFFESARSNDRSPAVSTLEDLENVAVTAPGRGRDATWFEVSRKTGSLVKVKVTVPFAEAVPTSVSPKGVSTYTVSPATMLGSVIVIVMGDVAFGDVPPVVCHDTANAAT
jgi:hypothetical protein